MNSHRKALVLLSCLLLAGPAMASNAVTTDVGAACRTKGWLTDFYEFLSAEDRESQLAYMMDDKCIVFDKGLRITLVDYGYSVSTFAVKGVKLWARSEVIRPDR